MEKLNHLISECRAARMEKYLYILKEEYDVASQYKGKEFEFKHEITNAIQEPLKAAMIGLAVGDALGVPVEFKPRNYLKENPVRGMIGFGAHNQPPGTWSDDTSLTLCLYDVLKRHGDNFELKALAGTFMLWYTHGYRTAHGTLFDIGNTTRFAIENLINKVNPLWSGPDDENSNGNGSLMRILPLAFYTIDKDRHEILEQVRKVSAITHGHVRTVFACYLYVRFVHFLLLGNSKLQAYGLMCKDINEEIESEYRSELKNFERILNGTLPVQLEDDIRGSGYVVHTLEASIWCFLNTENYKDAVLRAVNLGEDTDTTGAVTGGLAGLYYGLDSIPQEWRDQLAKFEL